MSSTMIGVFPATSPTIPRTATSCPLSLLLCAIASGRRSSSAYRSASLTPPRSGETITVFGDTISSTALASRGTALRCSSEIAKNPSSDTVCKSTATTRSIPALRIRSATSRPPTASRPSVLPRIAKVGSHRGDPRRSRPPAGIGHEQQLHQMGIDGRSGRLHQIDVASAYALLYLSVQLGIGEAVEDGAADGGAKPIGDRVGQRGISGARCNHKVHVHPTPGTMVTAG